MQALVLTLLTSVVLAGSLVMTRLPATDSTSTIHEVRMLQEGESQRFEPANLTIQRGDRVRFVTVSGAPHNIAFDPDSVSAAARAALAAGMPDRMGPLAGPLLMEEGDSYTITFANVPPGRYPFFCMPHLAMGMKGTITVE